MVLIPFDPADVQFQEEDRWEWWDSMRDWFAERGYTLYDYIPKSESKKPNSYWRPSRSCPGPVDFPYPHMASDDDPAGFRNNYGNGRVVFAQDDTGRHLAIKLVKGGSEEIKILKFLKDETCPSSLHSFPCVLPVLDLLSCENHWFAIMPRWSSFTFSPWFPTLYHAVLHMRCLLQALTFLHYHRIFHRDVAHRNILVNMLLAFRDPRSMKLRYAFFDFDRAIMLDEETYGQNPRLPIHIVDRGFYVPPAERLLGHRDFDPFKYDVACLGIYFDRVFGRFSAAQALAFTEYILENTSPSIPSYKQLPVWRGRYYERDRWKGLPDDFISTWVSHRDDSFSPTIKFQIWLVSVPWVPAWHALYGCRYIYGIFSGIFYRIRCTFRNVLSKI
ncbi:hypothetical protein CPB84DRAFT_1799794 [Gymnopilus junonius]|uniref:Protein kinase domain-containing protein n=1 Tax=Gymnopilus junonius TaxID=109634 RepID=A0A9P5N7H8_GYMJU|nr:hypothetical protein CPB84DRAFT_1799794 [Gymnopilus junonius]